MENFASGLGPILGLLGQEPGNDIFPFGRDAAGWLA